jgi:sulfoxide reductase heme-binding subunit YedZ
VSISERGRRWLQPIAITAGALPLVALCVDALAGDLGANPIETVTHVTGRWALRLLLLTLAVTPARRLTGWSALAPLRRTLGLLTFFYATLHMLTWVALDQFFDWQAMLEDIAERRYVLAGATAFLCLVPLALTSTRASMRRLGRRWIALHRLVYLAAVAAIVHYLWLVKADLAPPLAYAALLALLLGLRLHHLARRRARIAAPRSVS